MLLVHITLQIISINHLLASPLILETISDSYADKAKIGVSGSLDLKGHRKVFSQLLSLLRVFLD